MGFDTDTIVGIFLSTLVVLGFYIIGNLLTASGNINYCYMEYDVYSNNSYNLKGHIPWRVPITLAKISSLDEGITQAGKLHCKLLSDK